MSTREERRARARQWVAAAVVQADLGELGEVVLHLVSALWAMQDEMAGVDAERLRERADDYLMALKVLVDRHRPDCRVLVRR